MEEVLIKPVGKGESCILPSLIHSIQSAEIDKIRQTLLKITFFYLKKIRQKPISQGNAKQR